MGQGGGHIFFRLEVRFYLTYLSIETEASTILPLSPLDADMPLRNLVDPDVVVSCSSPRWENLPSGHQRYPLLGLNLGYMYWGQKHFSE